MVANLIPTRTRGWSKLEAVDPRNDVFMAYDVEMDAQDEKWGSQRHLPNETWMTILSEEVGEAAKEVLEKNPDLLIEELIQCGAVITQWIMALQSKGKEAYGALV